jgi:hypothetical protein
MRGFRLLLAFVVVAAVSYGCAGGGKAVMKEGPVNSGVEGQVLFKNEGAAEGAYVYAYDSPFNDMRVPTKLISETTDAKGSYRLELPPGEYYLVARKRAHGDDARGYLEKGDYEGKYRFNPVKVSKNEYAEVNLSISPLEGAFLMAPYLSEDSDTGIQGTVYDVDGSPARGAYVMVYVGEDLIGQPQYLSRPSEDDGSYNVVLPPGTYYVSARLKYGGLPRKGEPYGTYNANSAHMVLIGEKEVMTGVDIRLTPFPHDLAKPVD